MDRETPQKLAELGESSKVIERIGKLEVQDFNAQKNNFNHL
jgi:hypothetical protein